MNKLAFSGLVFWLVLSWGTGALADPRVIAKLRAELVQSVPVETSLGVPGIRDTQSVWIEMIRSARRTIDLEQFYASSEPGQALEPVLAAIQSAVARGVKVRLLVDSQFFPRNREVPVRLARLPSVQVRSIDFSRFGGIQHAKYFVVDGIEFYLGSANFDWRALSQIHEVGLHVADPGLASGLERLFEKDWAAGVAIPLPYGARPERPTPRRGYQAAPPVSGFLMAASPASANPAGFPDTLSGILKSISGAKSTIRVQVYDYSIHLFNSPERWAVLDDALRAAAARGIRVRLLVDVEAKKGSKAELKSLDAVPGVEVRVVKLPQWSGGPIPYARVIHSKYLLVDENLAWIGSENWSGNYFLSSRNVGVFFRDPALRAQLGRVFQQVWNSPYTARP